MLIYTQDGRLLRMGDGELKTTADDKRLLLIGEFVPEQVFIWYFVSVDEFTGFFMDDFQAGKGYMVVEDE